MIAVTADALCVRDRVEIDGDDVVAIARFALPVYGMADRDLLMARARLSRLRRCTRRCLRNEERRSQSKQAQADKQRAEQNPSPLPFVPSSPHSSPFGWRNASAVDQ